MRMERRSPHRWALLAAATVMASGPSGVASANERKAVPVEDLLDSIGVVTTLPGRGQPLDRTIGMVRYGGFGWVRGGIEGLKDEGDTTIRTFLDLHRETGVRISWGLVSGGTDVDRLIDTGRIMAKAGALLSFEGNNEPNNWGVVVDGVEGGRDRSWRPVADVQRRLYAAVRNDPALSRYPVWSISEPGAQTDDQGLQFLTIPEGTRTLMPVGTRYADKANLHNYPARSTQVPLPDNLAWNAADATPAALVDGIHGNHGETWSKRFKGYAPADLETLPRVTSETGVTLQGDVTEEVQGALLLDIYLAQFARGFSHTSVYLLRDRTDEPGNQTFGFFRPDYTPRKAAVYLHNLTSILRRPGGRRGPATVDYEIADRPDTLHELLLRRRDGVTTLVVWNERWKGEDKVRIDLHGRHDVEIHDPTVGIDPVRSLRHTSTIDLAMTDHPVVMTIARSR